MNYVLKLKTGFYKTTLCQISIQSNCINLIPLNSEMKDPILFTSSDLVSLHLIKDKHSEIEIKTRDQTLSGIFEENQQRIQYEFILHYSGWLLYTLISIHRTNRFIDWHPKGQSKSTECRHYGIFYQPGGSPGRPQRSPFVHRLNVSGPHQYTIRLQT